MKKKSKNLLLVIVLLAIIGIGVGYAALSAQLVLNGTATVSGSSAWNVHFVKASCKVASSTATSKTEPTMEIDNGLMTGTFAATLAPGEEVVYNVVITNEGTIPAELTEVEVSPVAGTYTTCTVSPTEQAGSISDGAVHNYTVTLACKPAEVLPETDVTEEYTVTFNYGQVVIEADKN